MSAIGMFANWFSCRRCHALTASGDLVIDLSGAMVCRDLSACATRRTERAAREVVRQTIPTDSAESAAR